MPENSLLERISALNVATEFLVPNISANSQSVVAKWLKADLAALEQLRKQMKKEEREGTAPQASSSALQAIIEAKQTALVRLEKKKKRPRAPAARATSSTGRVAKKRNGSPRPAAG